MTCRELHFVISNRLLMDKIGDSNHLQEMTAIANEMAAVALVQSSAAIGHSRLSGKPRDTAKMIGQCTM